LGDGDVPKTFPLSDQYVNTIKKAKEAMDGCLSEPDSENPHEKSKKPKKGAKTQKKQPKGRENLRVRKWTHHGNMVKFDLLS
jgi:hypothetical protein